MRNSHFPQGDFGLGLHCLPCARVVVYAQRTHVAPVFVERRFQHLGVAKARVCPLTNVLPLSRPLQPTRRPSVRDYTRIDTRPARRWTALIVFGI